MTLTPIQHRLIHLATAEALRDLIQKDAFLDEVLSAAWDTGSFSTAVAELGEDRLVSELSQDEASMFDEAIRLCLTALLGPLSDTLSKEL